MDLLLDLRATRALTYLFVAHDLRLVEGLSDRVAVMRAGRIVEIGRQVSHSNQIASNAVTEAEKANQMIQSLAGASQKIGEVIALINDIADQTNLLALNAAIEAARAGDQGRGFAVVADEVRKLAERTASSTVEINRMVHDIQNHTGHAVSSMEHLLEQANGNVGLSQRVGETISQINQQAKGVVSSVSRFAEMKSQTA